MHKKIHAVFIVALLVICLPLSVFAASNYIVKPGDTVKKIALASHLNVTQLAALNPQIKNLNLIYPGQKLILTAASTAKATSTTNTVIKVTVPTTTVSIPAVTVGTGSVSAAGETRFVAYTTGYGWPDNTPKGSADISHPVVHQQAAGTGTYVDPITLAVGHSISGNTDTLDYKAGTKFYIPNLEKYFIVEDTCGDGNSPQSGPCHTGYQGHPWLDLWVGGNASNQSATLACEDTITDTHLVIQNPASTYKVVVGDVASTCKQFSDVVLSISL